MAKHRPPFPFTDALRTDASFVLADLDPTSTPAFPGSKKDAQRLADATSDELDDLQERLYASSKDAAGPRSVLLVVQGMDTSGKGGIMRHVARAIDPQGLHYTAFKAPNAQERAHHFLWRIRRALPAGGQVGVFDRSHYEDVLIARVRNLVPAAVWEKRYDQINAFEAKVERDGTAIVKVMLYISSAEQKARLAGRLARPDKYYKFNPGDVDERALWPAYMEAYEAAVTRCTSAESPWYVVPADHKWYARLAVHQLLLERLRALDPQWPPAAFDVAEQQARVAAS